MTSEGLLVVVGLHTAVIWRLLLRRIARNPNIGGTFSRLDMLPLTSKA